MKEKQTIGMLHEKLKKIAKEFDGIYYNDLKQAERNIIKHLGSGYVKVIKEEETGWKIVKAKYK